MCLFTTAGREQRLQHGNQDTGIQQSSVQISSIKFFAHIHCIEASSSRARQRFRPDAWRAHWCIARVSLSCSLKRPVANVFLHCPRSDLQRPAALPQSVKTTTTLHSWSLSQCHREHPSPSLIRHSLPVKRPVFDLSHQRSHGAHPHGHTHPRNTTSHVRRHPQHQESLEGRFLASRIFAHDFPYSSPSCCDRPRPYLSYSSSPSSCCSCPRSPRP